MRVVLDTNVLISGFLWPGKESRVIKLCIGGELENIATEETIGELDRALHYPKFRLEEEEIQNILRIALSFSTIVRIKERVEAVGKDPSDDKFIEASIAGKADFIISGDRHLIALKEFAGTPILATSKFLRTLNER